VGSGTGFVSGTGFGSGTGLELNKNHFLKISNLKIMKIKIQ
jgi:hypothetical protein